MEEAIEQIEKRPWDRLPIPADLPEPGRLYQHYKGDYYRVITPGRLSEERDTWCVVYKSLKLGHVWIRPLTMFTELVPWPDGHMRPRFRLADKLPQGMQEKEMF